MRQYLLKDFTQIYHLDLHGNVRKNPKLSGTTHNVFGIQVGVGITIAIRSSKHAERAIYYARVPEDWTKVEKYQYLEEKKSVYGIDWLALNPNERDAWITEGLKPEFTVFIPMGDKSAKAANVSTISTLFKTYSRGAETTRDSWMYDFNREHLVSKAKSMIETYNAELARWIRVGMPNEIDDFVLDDEAKIKWSSSLKECLRRKIELKFESLSIREAFYRPFTHQYLYFDKIMTHRQGVFPQILPTVVSESENSVICLTDLGSEKPFMVLASNVIPDLHLVGAGASTQCFPYYTYTADGSNRRENITDWALGQFQERYGIRVSKWDIFHYVYAMLHHPQYRERYAENLKRDLPHIPLLLRPEAFTAAVSTGRTLMGLHINYEQQKEYPLREVDNPSVPLAQALYVEKMKLTPDHTALLVSPGLTLTGIPEACYNYRLGNRSALEWIIDQYQVTQDSRSGIRSDPNRADDPGYIVRLVKQVVAVSVQTVQLVEELAQAVTQEDWLGTETNT
jgi:predicted helicase